MTALALRTEWAERICRRWQDSVQAIIETGRLITEAKAALGHGEFTGMIESELPFGPRTAERLMVIGADPRISNPTHVSHLPASWGTLYELTKLEDEEFEQRIADGTIQPDMMRRDIVKPEATESAQPAAASEPTQGTDAPAPLPNGARSIMASRQEPDDSLDYSPTPPWVTRALILRVLPTLGVSPDDLCVVWDPACGEGHMTGVLEEYPAAPIGTDIFDYSVDGRMPPSWWRVLDFLADASPEDDGTPVADWIITNPPFSKAEEFTLKALTLAQAGVAMFVRWQWIETVGRYDRLFSKFPPAVVAVFAERAPLHMGRWEPNGSTATAYCWVVWKCRPDDHEVTQTRLFWIPPGQREALTRPDDRERFTAHPVAQRMPPHDPETGELIEEGESLNAGIPDGRQQFGRADEEQRDAPRIPGAERSRESGHEGDQGRRPEPAPADREDGPEPGALARQDQDGRSRHVGGQASDQIADPTLSVADGTHEQRNEGGSHVVGDHDAQDIGSVGAGEGLNAVPADPAPAAWPYDDLEIPECLRRPREGFLAAPEKAALRAAWVTPKPALEPVE